MPETNVRQNQVMPESSLPFGTKEKRYATLNEWVDAEKKFGYDLAGYIDRYGIPNVGKDQHLTDEFKLPHHITFSSDSRYHSPETPGGVWKVEERGPTSKEDVWSYTPSDFVLKQHPPVELRRYFNEHEPDAILNLPEGP